MEKNQITLEELKKQDPEKYFREVLAVSELEKLDIMVLNSSLVIDWDSLFKDDVLRLKGNKIEGIYWEGDLDFLFVSLKSLRKLKEINGSLKLYKEVGLEDLGELEKVKGDLDLNKSPIKSLGKLQEVGGNLNCAFTESLEDLGELEKVKGSLDIRGTKIKTLGKLKKVGGDLDSSGCRDLQSLGDLEEVGGNLDLREISVNKLEKLKKVGGDLDLNLTKIKALGNLQEVGGNLFCINMRKLEDLGNLKEVGGNLYIKGTPIEFQLKILELYNEGKLKVKGQIYFGGDIQGIEQLLDKEIIPGSLSLADENVQNIGKVKIIKGSLNCERTLLTSLENLEKVEGILYAKNCSVSFQIYILYQYRKGKIAISKLEVDNIIRFFFDKIYIDGKFNTNKFKELFGKKLYNIQDKMILEIAREILLRESIGTKEDIKSRGEKIITSYKLGRLNQSHRNMIKRSFISFDKKLQQTKELMKSFGLEE